MSTSWVCNLVEAIHYKTLEETYQVQRCFTGKDRVCDTTYDIDTTTKDDYQCCNVETPNFYMKEKTINDVTCTNTVEFNCKREKTTKNDGYGQKGHKRQKGGSVCILVTSLIMNYPRSKWRCARPMSTCTARSSPISSPSQQNCHFEPKKICELEMKTRPKKAKKYSYTMDCKEAAQGNL